MISLALASFHYWYLSADAIAALQRHFTTLLSHTSLLHGVEIGLTHDQIAAWASDLTAWSTRLPGNARHFQELRKKLLNLPRNSIHIPPLNEIARGQEKRLAEQLKVIFEHTGIAEITTHPDQCPAERVAEIVSYLPRALNISIENMDKRKKDAKSLEDLTKLIAICPSLKFTFDVCHWYEQGLSLTGKEIQNNKKLFTEKLSKIHFSSPHRSAEYSRSSEIDTFHYLSAHTPILIPRSFLELLPEKLTWVVEGVVPVQRFDLVDKEMLLLNLIEARQRQTRQKSASIASRKHS